MPPSPSPPPTSASPPPPPPPALLPTPPPPEPETQPAEPADPDTRIWSKSKGQIQAKPIAALPLPAPPPPQQKKPQPLPWTHDETVNLILAYQEKWYSLKRGQLKASQWDDVAATVAARCGAATQPTKTGTQCRHKMEKLRKRYRADRQRSRRPFWPYFDLMDQLHRGPLPISVAVPIAKAKVNRDDEDEEAEEKQPRSGYSLRSRKGRQSAAVGDRRIDEFKELVDGFFVGGGSGHEGSRFRKRKSGVVFAVEGGVGEDQGEEAAGGGSVVVGLAKQMREFAEMFVRMERKKMEMMRENERYRMEMERKRVEMILVAQQKTVDIISKALASSSQPGS